MAVTENAYFAGVSSSCSDMVVETKKFAPSYKVLSRLSAYGNLFTLKMSRSIIPATRLSNKHPWRYSLYKQQISTTREKYGNVACDRQKGPSRIGALVFLGRRRRRALAARDGLVDVTESSLGGSESRVLPLEAGGEIRWCGVTWPKWGSSSLEPSTGAS
jgi:hypothetical protein